MLEPQFQILKNGQYANQAGVRDTMGLRVLRAQVGDGAATLRFLMPVFVDLMMDHPQKDWGHPFHPVIE